jgi:FkbM family methyltransferase
MKRFETPWVLAARTMAFASRFFTSVENLGFASSIKLFSIYQLGINRDTSLAARKMGRPIHFRGAADRVLSHYFCPGFRIRDTPDHPVRFIIDAGANIGDETLRFRHFHPDAFIVALEPEPGNYRMLAKNTAGDDRIVAIQAGLWSHECGLSIDPNIDGGNQAFRVQEASPGAAGVVSAVSVPALMNLFNCQTIDILKMDIEGAEQEVFSRHTDSWIERVKVFIFECPDNDRPGTAFSIFRALQGQSFDCYVQGECLVLIRHDTGWKVETNLFLPDLARA